MRLLGILLFSALLCSSAAAQYPRKWIHLNGPNTGNPNAQLLFGPNGEIISVGTVGYYQTTDDGVTWEEHRVIPSIKCSSEPTINGLVFASTGEYYFYSGTNGSSYDSVCSIGNAALGGLYQSTDKGKTWKQILSNKNIRSMIESNDHHLFIYALEFYSNSYGSIYESIDRGKSWISIPSSFSQTFFFSSIGKYTFFFQSDVVYKIDDQSGAVIKFNDSLNYSTAAVQVKSDLLMVSDFYSSNIYTSNGDSSWKRVGHLPGFVAGLTSGRGDTVYAVVESVSDFHISIYYTVDQGVNWQKFTDINLPPTDYYYYQHTWSINCSNPNSILYENDSALYRSSDRGNSWKIIGLPFDTIQKITVANNGSIFTLQNKSYASVSNQRKLIFNRDISSDDGKSWQRTEPATSNEGISSVGRINGNIIAVARDSNETWNSVWLYDPLVPSQWVKRSVFQDMPDLPFIASDNERIFISKQSTSSDPFLYVSDDTGFTWNALNAPNDGENIYSLEVSLDGTIYFGTYPAMYRSDDHGITWVKLIPTREIVQLTAIKTFNANVFLGTNGAGLLESSDKGVSWNRIDGKNFDTVTSIGIDSQGNIAAGTNHGLWFFDTDTHQWSKIMLGATDSLYIGCIDVSGTDDFYIGTYGSSVWEGTTHRNVIARVPTEPTSTPLAVFPNPASEKIKVEFNSSNKASLEIYDMLGRKIASQPANNLGEMKIDQIPDGIYTIVVLSGKSRSMQKLIVQH
jgi:photosystem II stability/assembly factor-like uncharacterized protein